MKSQNLVLIFVIGIIGALIGSVISVYIIFPMQLDALQNQYHAPTKIIYKNITSSLQDHIFSILKENRDSVVYIEVKKSVKTFFGTQIVQVSGSGFIISEKGYIITNHHVVSDASNIIVIFSDGEETGASLMGNDPLNDIAVIKINPEIINTNLNPIEIGDSDKITQGELVLTMGSPFALQNTATLGIVSALNRTLISEGGYRIEKVIQTDAAINPGNSGGPLLNLKGEVIGINTAIISKSGGNEGIGFAIPINKAKKIYLEIIETGKVTRPWMGISGADVTDGLAKAWNLSIKTGVLVVDFTDYSPAKNAGFRETISIYGKKDFVMGDIITEVNAEVIKNNSDLLNVLLKYKPWDTVKVKVYRDGEYKTIKLKLGKRPENV